MELCVACGKACEATSYDANNLFRVSCKTYCPFEISRRAIGIVRDSEHEMNRFLLRLKSACDEKTILKVSYEFAGEKPTLKFLN